MKPDGATKKLSPYLKEDFKYDWTPGKIEEFQKAGRDVNHTVICIRQDLDKPELNFSKVVSNVD